MLGLGIALKLGSTQHIGSGAPIAPPQNTPMQWGDGTTMNWGDNTNMEWAG